MIIESAPLAEVFSSIESAPLAEVFSSAAMQREADARSLRATLHYLRNATVT